MTVLFNDGIITIKAGTNINHVNSDTGELLGKTIVLQQDIIFNLNEYPPTSYPNGQTIDGITYLIDEIYYYRDFGLYVSCVYTVSEKYGEEIRAGITTEYGGLRPNSVLAYGLICHEEWIQGERIVTFEYTDDAWGWGEGSRETISEIQYPDGTIYDVEAKTIVNQNGGSLKTWTGSLQEYNAITVKDSNTLYNITDDSTLSLSLLEIIYPVGSIYLTFNTSCPLALFFGTWELVGQDKVLQGAGTRGTVGQELPQSLPNITGNVGQDTGIGHVMNRSFGLSVKDTSTSGSFYPDSSKQCNYVAINQMYESDFGYSLSFDASHSSSIYQDGANVQPDAILVNIYRRVA